MISLNVADTESEVVESLDGEAEDTPQFTIRKHGVTQVSGEDLQEGEKPEGEESDEGGDDAGGESRPEWLDAKFKSPEDLAKAYKELEKKLGGQAAEKPANPLSLSEPAAPVKEEAPAKEAASKVDMDALASEFMQNGKLSEDTYKKIEAAGITRSAADRYIRGVQAEAQQIQAAVADVVGGDEKMTEVLDWARKNLTPGQKSVFEAAVRSGDVDAAALAMQGIYARYVASEGEEPNLVRAEGKARNTGPKPFASLAEASKAMDDPKYREDPKYRREIERRIEVSNW